MRKAKARKNLKAYGRREAGARKDDGKAFYAALENGLVGYLSDLSNLEFRGMTRRKARGKSQGARLQGYAGGADHPVVRHLRLRAQFAPVAQSEAEPRIRFQVRNALRNPGGTEMKSASVKILSAVLLACGVSFAAAPPAHARAGDIGIQGAEL